MKTYAVITGDISHFTSLGDLPREALIRESQLLLKGWVHDPPHAAFFRGDSYQILFDDPAKVLSRSVQLFCWFKMQKGEKRRKGLSTRMAVGIGQVSYVGKSVLDSDGEAFHLSGRNFDAMAPGEIIRVATNDEQKNRAFGVILMFMNLVLESWTPGQAGAIYWLLNDRNSTQEQIAHKLHIFQSGIANRLKIARWREVEKALDYLSAEVENLT